MSSVAVKLDENLGQTHVEVLLQAGYQADRVTDQGLGGESDAAVWQHVQERGLFFVTLDLDFSDIRRFTPGTHPGLLLLRPHNNNRRTVADLLGQVVREHPLETLTGCLTVAEPGHTRIRRPERTDSAEPD
jgi:predicted nuclease of predicted toxin-antitoxin system